MSWRILVGIYLLFGLFIISSHWWAYIFSLKSQGRMMVLHSNLVIEYDGYASPIQTSFWVADSHDSYCSFFDRGLLGSLSRVREMNTFHPTNSSDVSAESQFYLILPHLSIPLGWLYSFGLVFGGFWIWIYRKKRWERHFAG